MIGIQDITFNGKSLTEYGCVITESPKRPFPQRRYEKQSVYGRSGDLIIDGESYDNIQLVYKAATVPGLYGDRFVDEVLSELKAWLCSSVEYQKLYDTELPDGFYYAFCSGISDAVCTFDDMFEFEISFDMKPFFYLDLGQNAITVTQNSLTLYNPGTLSSKPIIEIKGNGTIVCQMGGKQFTISDFDENIVIDSERMLVNSNGEDSYSRFSGDYPILTVGNNTITFTGEGFLSAKIIPGWCRL